MIAKILKAHLSKIGRKGGKASWANLSKEERSERNKAAAKSRKRGKGEE